MWDNGQVGVGWGRKQKRSVTLIMQAQMRNKDNEKKGKAGEANDKVRSRRV
jgi:hypothetical protein